MKFRNCDTKLPELKEGESYWCIRYIGFGVGFKTIYAAKTKEEAKAWFEKFFPVADFHSIKKGTY